MFGKSAANPIDGLPGKAWDSLGTALRKKYKRHGVPRTAGSGEVPDAMGSAHPLMAPCAHDPRSTSRCVTPCHAASCCVVRFRSQCRVALSLGRIVAVCRLASPDQALKTGNHSR